MLKDYLKKYTFIRSTYLKTRGIAYLGITFFPLIIKKIQLLYFVIIYADMQTWLEFKILINGIKKYKNRLQDKNNTYYLKRQLHRLEKGLIQANPKREFAVDYILPTTEIINKLYSKRRKSDDFLKYGLDVLWKYFEQTNSNNKKHIKAKKIFKSLNYSACGKFIPFDYKSKKNNFSDFNELATNRRSIRDFSGEKVPRDVLNAALNTAVHAPSGCNRQPYRFIIIDDEKYLSKFSSMPPGGGGNSFNAPVLIFVIGDQSVASDMDSSHLSYIDASFAAMTFVFSLTDMGVGSCFLNWAHVYENTTKAMKKLKLKSYELIVTCIAVGYVKEGAKCTYSYRNKMKDLVEYYEE